MKPVHIIGGGLAGSESAFQLAERGVPAVLHEMRPLTGTPAHKTDKLAELVCSNSFRSDDSDMNAVGLLHYELRRMNSLIMAAADANQVPAGGALAVDREGFSAAVTAAIEKHPNIEIRREEISIPKEEWDSVIVATGPLTSAALADEICKLTGETALAFFDAIAPIVHRDSIDFGKAWFQSRYDKAGPGGSGADYVNCPMTREEYERFVAAVNEAEKIEFKEWEGTPYFDGCLPVEIMAARGVEVLRHGPLKPFGLTNPHDPQTKAYAVVQLRQDNKLGTLFNMVGFQTKLKHGEQTRVFRTIPGLENAEFARLGGLHRNTYLDAPKLLDGTLRLKAAKRLRFAGQITGCEGYVESASVGLMAGLFAASERRGEEFRIPPPTTALGALLAHITGGHLADENASGRSYQPMNINFGLFPPPEEPARKPTGGKLRGPARAQSRKQSITSRAKADMEAWLAGQTKADAAA